MAKEIVVLWSGAADVHVADVNGGTQRFSALTYGNTREEALAGRNTLRKREDYERLYPAVIADSSDVTNVRPVTQLRVSSTVIRRTLRSPACDRS